MKDDLNQYFSLSFMFLFKPLNDIISTEYGSKLTEKNKCRRHKSVEIGILLYE